MTSAVASIRRHPVLAYFALTFALTLVAWLVIAGGAPLSSPEARSDPRFLLAILVGPLTPAFVGLLLTGVVAGRAGYRELRGRLLLWRVEPRWYAVALLAAPFVAISSAVLLALTLDSPEFIPTIFTTPDPLGVLLPGLVTGLLVGFFEEIGWTGFAIPRLRMRYGIVATGLLVGVVWGAWHFPAFLESDSFTAALPLALLLARLFSWLPAFRVLMVWVYDRTGSLLVAVLMHVSLTATSMMVFSSGLSVMQLLTSILVSAGVWWLLVAAVALTSGERPARSAEAAFRERAA
jgi:membrane protease YdiL (CAAX protease family)